MPEKGRKKMRGKPELYNEVKGQVNVSLTNTGVQGLDTLAQQMGLSRSEFIEQIGRGILPVLTEDDLAALGKVLAQLQSCEDPALLSAIEQLQPLLESNA